MELIKETGYGLKCPVCEKFPRLDIKLNDACQYEIEYGCAEKHLDGDRYYSMMTASAETCGNKTIRTQMMVELIDMWNKKARADIKCDEHLQWAASLLCQFDDVLRKNGHDVVGHHLKMKKLAGRKK